MNASSSKIWKGFWLVVFIVAVVTLVMRFFERRRA